MTFSGRAGGGKVQPCIMRDSQEANIVIEQEETVIQRPC